MPTIEELAFAFSKRRAPIKAVLLDQNKPLCGIGNWMVDEILYQARVHPAHTASLLSLDQSTAIHVQIINIVVTACSVNAESKKFPKHWL
jgi:formamidopyrimidine-DNA glycosylase